ncbi:MAG TPA: polyketide synthase [Kofleriaceae bacterium]|nr:polyketide synthase [Kofleriaceae bacterium]
MQVVHTHRTSAGFVEISLEDNGARNMFSPALVEGLRRAFADLVDDVAVKVVVVRGYDNYFCCGGTRAELLRFADGKAGFADLDFYRILLDCPIPTIAAMQGHALGGGLAFGCYADMLVLAEESVYAANFMRYGFTPGMGATYILPKRFGDTIGSEMLWTARGYRGRQLRERGVQVPVVKRSDVVPAARALAAELSERPRASLVLLKERLNAEIKRALPAVIAAESRMHEVTFALPEVRARITDMRPE